MSLQIVAGSSSTKDEPKSNPDTVLCGSNDDMRARVGGI